MSFYKKNSIFGTFRDPCCGSLKKWSRGDKEWSEFRERIQRQLSHLLLVLSELGSLERAMEGNIVKIKARKDRGTLKGDGSER